MMAATAGHFGTAEVLVRAFLVVALLFMTTPIAAHVLAQAAYRVGTPLWKGTRPNELEDCYDELSGRVLGSPPPNDAVPPDEVQERRSR
jgi:multicomponent Na+:H+ antiporter subunit G